jgi:hypothetical protein
MAEVTIGVRGARAEERIRVRPATAAVIQSHLTQYP